MRRSVTALPEQATAILGPVMRSAMGCWVSYSVITQSLHGHWELWEASVARAKGVQNGMTWGTLVQAIGYDRKRSV